MHNYGLIGLLNICSQSKVQFQSSKIMEEFILTFDMQFVILIPFKLSNALQNSNFLNFCFFYCLNILPKKKIVIQNSTKNQG